MAKKQSQSNMRPSSTESRGGNKQILFVTYMFVLLFMGLLGYFLYFMLMQSKDTINNTYNKRSALLEKRVVRGKILSSEGMILAETITNSAGQETRNYPYGKMFAHVVGHSTEGKTGVELMENFNLLTSNDNMLVNVEKKMAGQKTIGDNAVTTLNVDLQRVAYDALGNNKGAIVVSEPSTGKILAMVSKPDYDPNPDFLNPHWDDLRENKDGSSCLLNRATQGLYPPGSTFKIFTALEYIREHNKYGEFRYDCRGSETQDGFTVNCYRNHVHGMQNLKTAFANSCNSCFAHIGTLLDVKSYRKTCEQLLFQKELPTTFVYNKSSFVLDTTSNKEEIMHTAMGQGKTQITPMHLNMLVSAIANKGVLMKSYVVDQLVSNNDTLVRQYKPKEYGNVMTEEEASVLTDFMKEVVQSGTASSLNSFSYKVAGKTGSAEFNQTTRSHSWFAGFAPANNPKICVTVIVEGVGTGSEYAVPIAKKLFQSYLGN